jgi:hypothetical protein
MEISIDTLTNRRHFIATLEACKEYEDQLRSDCILMIDQALLDYGEIPLKDGTIVRNAEDEYGTILFGNEDESTIGLDKLVTYGKEIAEKIETDQ